MREKLIFPLDVPTTKEALQWVEKLKDVVGIYKIGLQLFTADGGRTVEELRKNDIPVFLDLKFHDIPNTVSLAVASAARHNVQMLTLHTLGGRKMISAAVRAGQEFGAQRPLILGVTILTSHEEEALRDELGIDRELSKEVIHLARMAQDEGADGVVASVHEASAIRKACGPDFLIVTPGIRMTGGDVHDQKRIDTPCSALQNGATHLVVGRPIRQSVDPVASAKEILADMMKAESN